MDNSDKDTESKRKIQKIEVSTTASQPQSSETNPNFAYHFSWQTSLQKDLEEERKTNAEDSCFPNQDFKGQPSAQ